jgi:hypothetical protein
MAIFPFISFLPDDHYYECNEEIFITNKMEKVVAIVMKVFNFKSQKEINKVWMLSIIGRKATYQRQSKRCTVCDRSYL